MMERFIEIAEEIENIGERILSEGKEKAEKIVKTAKEKMNQLRTQEIKKAKAEIAKMYNVFEKELDQKIKGMIVGKNKLLKSISEPNTKKINVSEFILKEIIEL